MSCWGTFWIAWAALTHLNISRKKKYKVWKCMLSACHKITPGVCVCVFGCKNTEWDDWDPLVGQTGKKDPIWHILARSPLNTWELTFSSTRSVFRLWDWGLNGPLRPWKSCVETKFRFHSSFCILILILLDSMSLSKKSKVEQKNIQFWFTFLSSDLHISVRYENYIQVTSNQFRRQPVLTRRGLTSERCPHFFWVEIRPSSTGSGHLKISRQFETVQNVLKSCDYSWHDPLLPAQHCPTLPNAAQH